MILIYPSPGYQFRYLRACSKNEAKWEDDTRGNAETYLPICKEQESVRKLEAAVGRWQCLEDWPAAAESSQEDVWPQGATHKHRGDEEEINQICWKCGRKQEGKYTKNE